MVNDDRSWPGIRLETVHRKLDGTRSSRAALACWLRVAVRRWWNDLLVVCCILFWFVGSLHVTGGRSNIRRGRGVHGICHVSTSFATCNIETSQFANLMNILDVEQNQLSIVMRSSSREEKSIVCTVTLFSMRLLISRAVPRTGSIYKKRTQNIKLFSQASSVIRRMVSQQTYPASPYHRPSIQTKENAVSRFTA